MEYRRLGDSNVKVSLIGLGTMTWGEQNTEQEAHAQIDYALDHGVNLIDTAEMYPVPPRPETQGSTERYIGTWIAQHRGARDAHEALVAQVATAMQRAGRLTWRRLSLRARVGEAWVMSQPDVFSIRQTTVEAYAEPVVHEIKVSRADLLADRARVEALISI